MTKKEAIASAVEKHYDMIDNVFDTIAAGFTPSVKVHRHIKSILRNTVDSTFMADEWAEELKELSKSEICEILIHGEDRIDDKI